MSRDSDDNRLWFHPHLSLFFIPTQTMKVWNIRDGLQKANLKLIQIYMRK